VCWSCSHTQSSRTWRTLRRTRIAVQRMPRIMDGDFSVVGRM
jgi:hypothetical protein